MHIINRCLKCLWPNSGTQNLDARHQDHAHGFRIQAMLVIHQQQTPVQSPEIPGALTRVITTMSNTSECTTDQNNDQTPDALRSRDEQYPNSPSRPPHLPTPDALRSFELLN